MKLCGGKRVAANRRLGPDADVARGVDREAGVRLERRRSDLELILIAVVHAHREGSSPGQGKNEEWVAVCFSVIDVEISWFMATWFELLGSVAILIGLGTRYASISLLILTIVAAIAVHIPADGWSSFSDMARGYAISDKGYGNYKLPFMYFILFMPLIFMGPGKLSIDHLIYQFSRKS